LHFEETSVAAQLSDINSKKFEPQIVTR
jgi:hypothetical protein